MDAAPRLALLGFGFKTSTETAHFAQKLKQYISEVYHEDGESYRNELHHLEGMRARATHPTADASGYAALVTYFCQLRALQTRFPMGKGQPASVHFTWKDVYQNTTHTSTDIKYELASVMYNIGAVHSQLGAQEDRTTSEGLKSACTHFQTAAWAFQEVREQYGQSPERDISPEVVAVLQELSLAQAQECILEKSICDGRKPSVVAAVAMQVLVFYRTAELYLCEQQPHAQIRAYDVMGSKRGPAVLRYTQFKIAYVGCLAQLYHGLHAEEQQKMGERVAFYQLAVEKLAAARKLAKHIEPPDVTQEAITFTGDVVEGKRKGAKNENEFIYHEEVPDKELLTELKPVNLVKPTPINFNDPKVSGTDLFARLVPIGAHEASSLYSEEKAKLLRKTAAAAEAKDHELAAFMSSLQLDLLDATDAEESIPQEVVDRCAAMNADSGIIQTLVDAMNSLAEISSDVEHALDELNHTIQEEIAQEKEYQAVMGSRPPSIVQTDLSREAKKYSEAHAKTSESNQVLHKAMTLHLANLRLLASPLKDLCDKLPSVAKIEGLDTTTLAEMKRVMAAVREMQSQRSDFLRRFREAVNGDDITAALLARPNERADDIFQQELKKHDELMNLIELNLSAQENIINRMTSVYAQYGESRKLLNDVVRRRDALINALITSYDTRSELLAKSQAGLEFYRKLANNVSQLLARLRSTCQVQREERATLLAKHKQKGVASTASASGARLDSAAVPPATDSSAPKLKDYLPYMKNRAARNQMTNVPADKLTADQMYPESMYPTSARPAPVGSEASTDPTPAIYTDGYADANQMGTHSLYSQYNYGENPYAVQNIPSSNPQYSMPTYDYQQPEKCYTPQSVDSGTSYGSNYTPSQYPDPSSNITHSYYSPYYTGSQEANTNVTNSQTAIQYGSEVQANTQTNQYYMAQQEYANQGLGQGIPNQPSMSQQVIPIQQTMPQQCISNQPTAVQHSIPNQQTVNYQGVPNQQTVIQQAIPNQHTYGMQQLGPSATPSVSASNYGANFTNSNDLADSYSQMQISGNNTPYDTQYSQTYFSAYYQQNAASNVATYSSAAQPAPTSMSSAGQQPEYYPYGAADMPATVYQTAGQETYDTASPTVQYTHTQYAQEPTQIQHASVGTPYDSTVHSQLSSANTPAYPEERIISSVARSNVTVDQPIKSHITGQALPKQQYPQNYSTVDNSYQLPADQAVNQTYQQADQTQPANQTFQQAVPTQPSNHFQQAGQNQPVNPNFRQVDQAQMVSQPYQANPTQPASQTFQQVDNTNDSYAQSYQNHPGYYYNSNTGTYEYNYGYQTNADRSQSVENAYTSAGKHDTVQSPAVKAEPPSFPTDESGEQNYYNSPYGYQSHSAVRAPASGSNEQTNYRADANQPTYMSSGNVKDSISTYTKKESPISSATPDTTDAAEPASPLENSPEQSAMDLLSGLDFSVETQPLMPEIKVPPVSEHVIRKPPPQMVQPVHKETKVEELERPAKRDLFSDPALLNKFTQEVKRLQKFVDSLTDKTPAGITVLDQKWKTLHDIQAKENAGRSKSAAANNSASNVVCDVVPYDDSRLTLKVNPEVYLNASHYKQLAPWCIPLVISGVPPERDRAAFWTAALENRVACVICLMSEMEVQGKCYWPTAKGQSLELDDGLKVTLDDAATTVHWTERRLTVARRGATHTLTHYQITVFPAKVVSGPLVLLVERLLSATYSGRLSNQLCAGWVHCERGGGRSALLALLACAVCQVRAGQVALCDMLDAACLSLYKGRTNVLEDTKFLADAYRTTLFYVQGVLLSGTTNFSGEAVATASACATPAPPLSAPRDAAPRRSRESFELMRQTAGLKSGDMQDPLSFLDPLWSLKKK